jgi:hypothetical protein
MGWGILDFGFSILTLAELDSSIAECGTRKAAWSFKE